MYSSSAKWKFIAVAAGLAIFVVARDFNWSNLKKQYMTETIGFDMAAFDEVWDTSDRLVKDHGIIVKSLSDLERTAFYPFTTSLSPTAQGGRIKLDLDYTNRHRMMNLQIRGLPGLRWFGYTFDPDVDPGVLPTTVEIQVDDLEQQNSKRAAFFLSGVDGISKVVQRENLSFGSLRTMAAKLKVPFQYKSKPPIPMPDLDNRSSEVRLNNYVKWLRKIEGVEVNCDAWGTPERFYLRNNRLQYQSAGPDRKFGTADDISRFSRAPWQ